MIDPSRPNRSLRSALNPSAEDRAIRRRREALQLGRTPITGTDIRGEESGASCVITTDTEGQRLRGHSHVQSIELRTYVYLDSLQPQLAAYMGTVSQ